MLPTAKRTVPAVMAIGVAIGLALAVAIGVGPVSAETGDDGTAVDNGQEEPAAEDAEDPAVAAQNALIREGAEVYSQICSSCHQPGGVGLPPEYPPLLDNPAVDDASYVADVIENGLQGEITVLGQTYNGVMPSFSTLADDDVEAVIAYVQSGFAVPPGDEAALGPTGPVAGTELPGLANAGALIAYLLAALVIGSVLFPRLASVNDRLDTPWLDVGLKTATIVVAIAFTTVVLPDWVLTLGAVADLDRPVQDAIGLGVWGAGLVGCLAALWYFHRESRI